MKPLTLALLAATPVMAAEQAQVQLLERQVSVEVAPQRTQSQFDETPIWKILEKEGWQAAQQAAANNKTSEKLNTEISYQEALNQLTQAVKTHQNEQARQLLAAHPDWASCQRIQWAWLDLQQEVATGYGPKAKQKFTQILTACPVHGLSTTQKLLGWTRNTHDSDILARYRQSAGYQPEAYNKLAYQVHLTQLGQARLSTADADAAGKQVTQLRDAKGAEMLGWQYYRQKQYSQALMWFDQSIQWTRSGSAGTGQPNKKQIEGKILTLQQLGRSEDASRLQQQWASRYPALKKLNAGEGSPQLTKVCKSEPQACLELLYQQPSMTASQYALAGWQWYKLDRPLTAKRAFEQALEAMPGSDKQFQDTQYGYTLALNKAGFEQHAEFLANKLADPQRKMLYAKQRESKAILNAYEQQNYQFVIEHSEAFEDSFGKEVGLTEIKGWAYYNQKQNTKAVETFRKLVEAYPYDERFQDALKTAECAQKKSYKLCY